MRITVTGPHGRELTIDDERLTPFREALGEVAQEPTRLAFAATHLEVTQDDVELSLMQQLDRLISVTGLVDLVTRFL